VCDPFAARLCGERGFAILRELPYANVMKIGMAIRTRFLDDLLLEVLKSHSITAVLSVGSGLDTRPPRVSWIRLYVLAIRTRTTTAVTTVNPERVAPFRSSPPFPQLLRLGTFANPVGPALKKPISEQPAFAGLPVVL